MLSRPSRRKSRYGCKECKQRHVKCDETRPCCVNCKTVNRHCSFRTTCTSLPRPAASPNTLPTDNTADDSSYLSFLKDTKSAICPTIPALPAAGFQVFTLRHLEFMDHFRAMSNTLVLDEGRSRRFIDVTISRALETPYLMDQLLATSAVHLSTLRPKRKHEYREEAMRLQTRALALFNSPESDISHGDYLSMFLFSILLGQQVMFETLLYRGDLSIFLDKLVSSLRMSKGIGVLGGHAYRSMTTQFQELVGADNAERWRAYMDQAGNNTDYDSLVGLIRASSLSDSSSVACLQAVDLFQTIYRLQRSADTSDLERANLALKWPVIVSTEYIDLVDKRLPEALIILAHYASLLHNARQYWQIGDVGKFVVLSIQQHLGEEWNEWLAWPLEEVQDTMLVET